MGECVREAPFDFTPNHEIIAPLHCSTTVFLFARVYLPDGQTIILFSCQVIKIFGSREWIIVKNGLRSSQAIIVVICFLLASSYEQRPIVFSASPNLSSSVHGGSRQSTPSVSVYPTASLMYYVHLSWLDALRSGRSKTKGEEKWLDGRVAWHSFWWKS